MTFVHHIAPEKYSAHMLELRARIRAGERAARLALLAELTPPPPSLPAERVTGLEPWFPSSGKSVMKLAAAQGWWARATKAIGPRIGADGGILEPQAYTTAVAVAKNDERLVWVWRWNKDNWKLQDVLSRREGLINHDRGKAVIRG